MTDNIRVSERDLVRRDRAMDFPGIGFWAAVVIVFAINAIWLLISERLSLDTSSVRMVLLFAGLTAFFVSTGS